MSDKNETHTVNIVTHALDSKNQPVSKKDLVDLLCIKPSEVQYLTKQGAIVPVEGQHGQYDLVASIQAYAGHLRSKTEFAKTSAEFATAEEMAKYLGLSDRTIRTHRDAGVLVSNEKSRYHVMDNCARFCRHLNSMINASGGTDLSIRRIMAATVKDEQTAKKIRLDNETKEGELIPKTEVREMLVEISIALKMGLAEEFGRENQDRIDNALRHCVRIINKREK